MSKVKLTVDIFKQGGAWVAYAPALDISTCARTEKAVQRRFEELVEIYLDELTEMGTLDEVLGEMGWKKEKTGMKPPVVSTRTVGIAMPV